MKTYYYIDGIIVLKRVEDKLFYDKFVELLTKHDKCCITRFNGSRTIMFKGRVEHEFIEESEKLMSDNINSIYESQIWFYCLDKSDENGFDFIIFRETVNGVIHQNSLVRRLNCDWENSNYDPEWEKLLESV